jgi:hypothetical protein
MKSGEPIPLGAFSGDREIFLKFKQTKPIPTSRGLNKIPIQFQMEYFDAKGKNKILSLEKLGEISGIFYVEVGKILKRVGLEPMHGSRERRGPLNESEKQILES